jgi:hypothetical protein
MSYEDISMINKKENLINNIDFDQSQFSLQEEERDKVEAIKFEVSTSNIPSDKSRPQIINNMSLSSIRNTRTNFLSDSSANFNISSLKKIDSKMSPLANYSRLDSTQKIIFQREAPTAFFVSKYREFCAIKCNIITTYFIQNFIFSLFTNPKSIEKFEGCRMKFFLANVNAKEHEDFFNSHEIIFGENIIQPSLDQKILHSFICEVNSFFKDPEFIKIHQAIKKKKLIFYILTLVLTIAFILIISLSAAFGVFQSDDGENPTKYWIVIIIIFAVEAILLYVILRAFLFAFVITNEILRYDILNYHLKNFHNIEATFLKWNEQFFLKNNIFVSCPVNLEYLQFNLEPTKEVVLEHHELEEGAADN